MFDNARYNAALWAHIGAILAVFAGLLIATIALGRARRAKSSAAMARAATIGAIGAWVTIAICAVALVPALYMVPKKWSWQQAWVRAGLFNGALMVILLAGIVGPLLWRLARAARRSQELEPAPTLRRAATHPLLWGADQLATTLFTGNVADMYFKPGTALALLIVVLAILAGLLSTLPSLRRYRKLSELARAKRG